jgi:phosphoglycerate kinase
VSVYPAEIDNYRSSESVKGETPVKNIRDLEVEGKKLLIRVDFNVPLDENGTITQDTRIRGALPTIDYALKQGAAVILCSHLGRPKGKRDEKFSLRPVAAHLSGLLGREVKMAPDCIGDEVLEMAADLQPGEVLLLENLRFHSQETENDEDFSRRLASLADIYINDAFAVSHRTHASVVGVTAFFEQCAAGMLLQKEMDYFHRAIENPRRPLVSIIGGAKVSGKLEALHNLMDRADKLLIGGAMANTFLKAIGYEVGQSKVEEDLLATARELLEKARTKGIKLYLPVDCVAADRFAVDANRRRVTAQEIPSEWMALDIGPATVILFAEALDDAQTIVWNGPMGAFEMDPFSRGTMAMVQHVAHAHALSIVGGGDTDAAVKKAGEAENISYMSTGGGAFLMLMEGKTLPGVAALD